MTPDDLTPAGAHPGLPRPGAKAHPARTLAAQVGQGEGAAARGSGTLADVGRLRPAVAPGPRSARAAFARMSTMLTVPRGENSNGSRQQRASTVLPLGRLRRAQGHALPAGLANNTAAGAIERGQGSPVLFGRVSRPAHAAAPLAPSTLARPSTLCPPYSSFQQSQPTRWQRESAAVSRAWG